VWEAAVTRLLSIFLCALYVSGCAFTNEPDPGFAGGTSGQMLDSGVAPNTDPSGAEVGGTIVCPPNDEACDGTDDSQRAGSSDAASNDSGLSDGGVDGGDAENATDGGDAGDSLVADGTTQDFGILCADTDQGCADGASLTDADPISVDLGDTD